MVQIKDLKAREILDSRGNPTVEAKMICSNGVVSVASVPSGASTGSKEALELRDNDLKRYNGLGVLKAVNNINTTIRDQIMGCELNQLKIDKMLMELDGTENKSRLGANAILAVSLCCIKALAQSEGLELYEYLTNGKVTMPIICVNILNGGMHAGNNLDIQEFMIVPIVPKVKEKIRVASEIFHTLKKILKGKGLSTGVGDEGGFAPDLPSNSVALDIIIEAIKTSGYTPGKDVFIALDIAANSFYNKLKKVYKIDNLELTKEELLEYYKELINKYPILSIEDPFEENDLESFAKLTNIVNNQIMLVGDDVFVTNQKYLQKGIDMHAGNAVLIKANQIGTVTEMTKTVLLAKKNNYKTMISHRSGETLDTFIADFAVGLNIPFIKTGSMSRGERICKYNRLMEIEERLEKKNK